MALVTRASLPRPLTFAEMDGNLTLLNDSKVDKITGKNLSTNDFTNTLKTKLENMGTGGGFDPETLPNADNSIPQDYVVRQGGAWVKATHAQMIIWLGSIPPVTIVDGVMDFSKPGATLVTTI